MLPKHLAPAALATSLLLTACERSGTPNAQYIIRDSAGVTIVESSAPAWGAEQRWSVVPEPVLSIGSVEGNPAFQLHRVNGVVRMRDGRIVIANGGSNELRVFSADGANLKIVGGTGSGPGEFQALFGLFALPGDSLLAYDASLSRISLFGPSGDFVRVIEAMANDWWRPRIYATLPDGSMITTDAVEPFSHMSLPSGFLRHPSYLIRRRADFTPLDTVGIFLGQENLNVRGNNFAAYIGARFLRQTHVAIRDWDIVVGEADQYELRSFGYDGAPLMIIRKLHNLQRLRDDEIERVRNSDDPDLRPLLMDLEFPQSYPAYAMLRADTYGNLWVKEFPLYAGSPTDLWTILSPGGEWLGAIDVPRTTAVVEIGSDFILALVQDDLGVEHVRMYRLNR